MYCSLDFAEVFSVSERLLVHACMAGCCMLTGHACVSHSGSFIKLLSKEVKKTCRKLDQVKVIGSDKVTEMWYVCEPLSLAFLCIYTCRRLIDLSDCRTCDVPRIKSKQFLTAHKNGVELYVKGKWQDAIRKLEDARAVSETPNIRVTLCCG